ncbi:MAG TPA: hypothetical protein VFG63_12815 [Nocardioidaceae bacterium]|nr:hypothetical protein [Nocardioidaceae bacterium]
MVEPWAQRVEGHEGFVGRALRLSLPTEAIGVSMASTMLELDLATVNEYELGLHGAVFVPISVDQVLVSEDALVIVGLEPRPLVVQLIVGIPER